MKKIVLSVICILMAVTLIAQEKYPIPVRTADQKHGRTLSQFYWVNAAGIAFAKSQGVTPYEYGKFCGNLAAPTWGPGNDFEGFVRGIIYNLENFRHVTDTPLIIKENEDGSVSIVASDKQMHRFYPEGKSIISYEEVKESMTGSFEPIAAHMGAIITMETKDTLLVFTLKKK
jgi:hypothetical protein